MAKLNSIQDDFSGGAFDTTKWTSTGSQTQSGGTLSMSAPNNTGPSLYTNYTTYPNQFDMQDTLYSWEWVSVGTQHASYETYCYIDNSSVDAKPDAEIVYMQWTVKNGSLLLHRFNRGTGTIDQIFSATYNNTTHRFFRFVQSGTTLSAEYASATGAWNVGGTDSTAGRDISKSLVVLSCDNTSGSTKTWVVDNINVNAKFLLTNVADTLQGQSVESPTFPVPSTSNTFFLGGYGSNLLGATYYGSGSVVGAGVELQLNSIPLAQTVDNITLQANPKVQDATHGHTVDNVVLTQHVTLTVADTLHGHTVDNILLEQANMLTMQDALHGHTVDNIALTQKHTLTVADTLHAHTAENTFISVSTTIMVDDAFHGHTSDNLALVQKFLLIVQDALHAHTVDSVVLLQHQTLAVADTLHAHTAESPTMAVTATLIVQDTLHAHTAESTVILIIVKPKPQAPNIVRDTLSPLITRVPVEGGIVLDLKGASRVIADRPSGGAVVQDRPKVGSIQR